MTSYLVNNDDDNKQIFHAFLFNIRNYSPEVINIQRREAELNIILPRVNNFDIKQNWHGIFVSFYTPSTKQNIESMLKGKINFSDNTTFFIFTKSLTITYLTTAQVQLI